LKKHAFAAQTEHVFSFYFISMFLYTVALTFDQTDVLTRIK